MCCFPLSPLSLAPIAPFLPLRPVRSRALLALPSWLLATLFDGLAPSAGVGRCPYGPTRRLATMSCVCSTHHFLRTLNSFLSSFQRNSLALSSLLLHRALPGPRLFFLLFAPPELFLLLLAPPEPLLLSLALPALSFLPLAPPALSSLPLALPAPSSLPLAPPALSSAPLAPPALCSLLVFIIVRDVWNLTLSERGDIFNFVDVLSSLSTGMSATLSMNNTAQQQQQHKTTHTTHTTQTTHTCLSTGSWWSLAEPTSRSCVNHSLPTLWPCLVLEVWRACPSGSRKIQHSASPNATVMLTTSSPNPLIFLLARDIARCTAKRAIVRLMVADDIFVGTFVATPFINRDAGQ